MQTICLQSCHFIVYAAYSITGYLKYISKKMLDRMEASATRFITSRNIYRQLCLNSLLMLKKSFPCFAVPLT